MKYVVVSVRDVAAKAYGRPMFVASVGQAIRSFQDEINRQSQDNVMYMHPEDFELFELGTFDEENGQFVNLDFPKSVAVGKQMSTKGRE